MTRMKLNYHNMIRLFEKAQSLGFFAESASEITPMTVGTQLVHNLFTEVAGDRNLGIRIPLFLSLAQALQFLMYLIE